MKVIREKSILEKIDTEIDDNSKPPIVRIDLNEGEFEDFLKTLSKGILSTSFEGTLIGLKTDVVHKVSKSSVRMRVGRWSGSYVVYREVCVQCCYEGDL